jgi:hypothetical protein
MWWQSEVKSIIIFGRFSGDFRAIFGRFSGDFRTNFGEKIGDLKKNNDLVVFPP